jgi:hypothetical protein
MGTLRQYFETDFDSAIRVHASHSFQGENFDAAVLYDVPVGVAFISCYIPENGRTYDFFVGFLESMKYGVTPLAFAEKVSLPKARYFPGTLKITKSNPLEINYRLSGDPLWRSALKILPTGGCSFIRRRI